MHSKIKTILFSIFILTLFLHSNCEEYPNISGTWQVTITTTSTTCLFEDDLVDTYIVVITQSEDSGTITIYDSTDTSLSTELIQYNFTITPDGDISIEETATYNPAYGLPTGVSSATSSMQATGTATTSSLSMTYYEVLTAQLIDGPIPVYTCTRSGTIIGSK